MGKASVDLPDPLEQPAAAGPTPAASADDLLSQLAGDEIDRLLAEAEAERPAAPIARAAGADATPAQAQASSPDDDRAPVAEARAEETEQQPAPGASMAESAAAALPAANGAAEDSANGATEDSAAVSDQLDDLFKQLDTDGGEGKPAPATPPPADAAPPTAPTTAPAAPDSDDNPLDDAVTARELDQAIAQAAPKLNDSDEAEVDPLGRAGGADESVETETSAAERSLLDAPATSTADAERGDGPDEENLRDLDAAETPLPLYLKPLVWLNAPFASLPEAMREALGKAAVLTLVNAIAVLLYVLIFRRG